MYTEGCGLRDWNRRTNVYDDVSTRTWCCGALLTSRLWLSWYFKTSTATVASLHICSRWLKAASWDTSITGRGGTVLANFRCIFTLKQSGTALPRHAVTLTSAEISSRQAHMSFIFVADLESATSTVLRNAARCSSRVCSAFFSWSDMWLSASRSSSVSSISCSIDANSKLSSKLRLKVCVTKSSSYTKCQKFFHWTWHLLWEHLDSYLIVVLCLHPTVHKEARFDQAKTIYSKNSHNQWFFVRRAFTPIENRFFESQWCWP